MVAGKEYPMCLTVEALAAISTKYGELGDLGDSLRAMPPVKQFNEVLWLVALLLREGCARETILHPEAPITAPGEAALAVLFTPGELADLRAAIFRCMAVGMGREIPTEEDGKNGEAGPEPVSSMPG